MNLTALRIHPNSSYVLPDWKMLYVSVPKAACTSLKWFVAALQGENEERFHATLSEETTRGTTLHRRSRWQHTPSLHDLTDAERASISPDNGWFVFAVIRHPVSRVWSGWQSKVLLREPRFLRLYPAATWPRVPQRPDDIVEDFHSFVQAMAKHPESRIYRDRHFRNQADLVRPSFIPYTRIYETGEFNELLHDLELHLKPLGLDSMPTLTRSNETPLPPIRPLFTPDVLKVIEQHYAVDFDSFGFASFDVSRVADRQFSEASVDEVVRLIERAERIGDLHGMARDWRESAKKTRAELATTQRELAGVRAELNRKSDTASSKFRRLPRRLARLLSGGRSH